MEETDYAELLRPLVAGRRVVLAGGVVAAFTSVAELIRRLGAEAVLVVGTEGVGSGPPPAPEVASWIAAQPAAAESLLAVLRAGNRVLADPPPEMRHALEAFDPAGTALVIGTFLNESTHFLGRPFLAHRRPEWIALDDKTTVDGLWDAVGVTRAPAAVVSLAEPGAARRAAAEVATGRGTVWAADSVSGWHGGAEGLRWVRRPGDVDEAIAAFAGYARRVRIMPFLDGVPCSIHGIVYPDHVIAVRPVEQITLRRVDHPTFFYAGCATFFDPPGAVTEAMRDLARRVGAHLRSTVGFRGAFCVDGVIGADGFRPTELNPRSGAGLGVIQRGLPELPLSLLLEALVGGVDAGVRPAPARTHARGRRRRPSRRRHLAGGAGGGGPGDLPSGGRSDRRLAVGVRGRDRLGSGELGAEQPRRLHPPRRRRRPHRRRPVVRAGGRRVLGVRRSRAPRRRRPAGAGHRRLTTPRVARVAPRPCT